MLSFTSYKKEIKSVVNKTLVKDIADYVEALIDDVGPDWEVESHRQSVVSLIEEFMAEVANDGNITQYKVVCDRRNNNGKDLQAGLVKLDVTFRQKNCFAVTQILYTITLERKKKQPFKF